MTDISTKIRHALENPITSDEIEAVLRAIEAAQADNRHWRAEHEAVIVDPLSDSDAVEQADRSLASTHLTERRLTEAARRLGLKLADVKAVEVEADRTVRYAKAKAIRDKAAAEIREAWTKHAKGLAAVVARIKAVDAEVHAAYEMPPKGEALLGSVIEGLDRPGLQTNAVLPFTEHLALPAVPEWGAPGFKGEYIKYTSG